MPRFNPERRRLLADAGIEVLAAGGMRGFTHRAVERVSELPPGTASNYFPSRDDLLAATAERAVALHLEQMQRIDREADVSGADDPLVELLTASLRDAAGPSRRRYVAIFELQLEASRRSRLAAALSRLAEHSLAVTRGEHGALELRLPQEGIGLLMTLYGGALFALVGSPVPPDDATVRRTAAAIVAGARAVA